MFKYRGQKYYTDEWITGYLTSNDHIDGEWVKPGTLSVSFGKLDSTGTEIFASFPIDGVMTEGGDAVDWNVRDYKVIYNQSNCEFTIASMPSGSRVVPFAELYSQDLTIIGKQGGG